MNDYICVLLSAYNDLIGQRDWQRIQLLPLKTSDSSNGLGPTPNFRYRYQPISNDSDIDGGEMTTIWLIFYCIMSSDSNELICEQPATTETTLLKHDVASCEALIQFDDIIRRSEDHYYLVIPGNSRSL